MESRELTPAWFASTADVPGTSESCREHACPRPGFLLLLRLKPRMRAARSNKRTLGQQIPVFAAGMCVVPGLAIAAATPPCVSQGNSTTPYTFTVVISNTDYLTPTGPLSLTLQVPDNFYYVGNTAAAQSQVSGTLAVVQPLVDQAAGKPVQVVVRANPETETLPPGDVVTVTYRLAATTSGAPNPTITNTLAISGELAACTVLRPWSAPAPARCPCACPCSCRSRPTS